jgi:hypothetical protein
MTRPPENCRLAQEQLLDEALGEASRAVPEELTRHLKQCSTCRAFHESLLLAPRLLSRQPLYSPALKVRTVARIEETEQSRTPSYVPFLTTALTLMALTSLVIPVWLLSEALSVFFASGIVRLGLSVFLAYSLGGVAAGLCTVPLTTRIARGPFNAFSGGDL